MTLALQWGRYCDCNPGGKRLYQYSQFCKKVGGYARTHDLAARIAHEPGQADARRLGRDDRHRARPGDGEGVARLPLRRELPLVGMGVRRVLRGHAQPILDLRPRPRPPGGRRLADIIVPDNCATATDRRRKSEPVKVNGAYLEMAEHYGCAVVPGARQAASRQGGGREGRRPVRDVGARPNGRRAVHEPGGAQHGGAQARRRAERQALRPSRGVP